MMKTYRSNPYDNIPTELTELVQWCVYRKEWVPERQKYTKIPYNPLTGFMAKSNDPETWVDFETAVEYSDAYDGIGFFFANGYFGVDLDNVQSEIMRYKDDDWENNIVADFIETLTSYSELSPSGNGVHIICRGSLPVGGRRKGDVEMYDSGRFFAMTGNKLAPYFSIFDDNEWGKINFLHHKYIGEQSISVDDLSSIQTDGNYLTIDEVIEEATQSNTGTRFKLFMDGGWEQFYNSQSEADLAFANDLAFWCARDYEKMDAIFRRSSLMREKWDKKREEATYGYLTLHKAISTTRNVYQPFRLNIDPEALKGTDKPKAKQKSFSYDDTGNTQRFLYAFGENVLYSYKNKEWYYFNKKFWAVDEVGKVYKMADYIADSIQKEPIKVSDTNDEKLVEKAQKNLMQHVKYTRNYKGKENMLKNTQHMVAVETQEFDKNLMLFNVQNGYIDLNNGHLMSHETSKEKKFTRISYAEYRPETACPRWITFLDEIFEGNQELIDYLQRAIGYSMCGETIEQMMFILLGNGKNGKSVLLNVLNEMFGTYAMNIQPDTIAVKQGAKTANADVARLKGARFVTTTEPNRGMKLDEGVVKQITGGDTVTARFLYGKEFEFSPEFKLWMATNYKPVISGTDDGIWRRIAIIPFNYSIPDHKVDKRLTYKLKEELTGILNWCLDGYVKWRTHGLNEPQIIKDGRHDYRSEMDMVQRFIEEQCVVSPVLKEDGKNLWESFRKWVKDNNEYDNFSAKRFHMELTKRFEKQKGMYGIVYFGISLNKDAEKNLNVSKMFDNIPEIQ